jgi:hypothetical protein
MNNAIQFMASASVFAFSLWISLRILSPSTTDNKSGLAVFVGIVFTAAGMFGGLGLFGCGLTTTGTGVCSSEPELDPA